MNRYQEIDYFLKYFRDVYTENPNLEVTYDSIYGSLSGYGVSEAENLKPFHQYWIDNFKDVDNIDVFVAPNWQYFCQFKNLHNDVRDTDRLKLYIPVDGENIYDAANKIFGFMAANKIEHMSKIGSKVRSDDIVIRLENEEDLPKLREYVSQLQSVNNGKLRTNPFVMSDGVMGYAVDGLLSYNSTVAKYLNEYFNTRKNSNTLSQVSYEDFYSFVYNRYTDVFINGNGIPDYVKKYELGKYRGGLADAMTNYYQVTRLILLSLNPNCNINDLMDHLHECNNKELVAHIKKNMNNFINEEQKSTLEDTIDMDLKNELNDTVKEVVDLMISMYGFREAKSRINNYINTNDAIYLPDPYRDYFNENISNLDLFSIINDLCDDKGVDFYLDREAKKLYKNKVDVLNNASLSTYEKYQNVNGNGANQLYSAIDRGLSGNYNCFSNVKGGRDDLYDNVGIIEFKDVLYASLNLDLNKEYDLNSVKNAYINNCIRMYENGLSTQVDNMKNAKIEALNNASILTYKKYQNLNGNGVNQLSFAITQGMVGNYKPFTNDNNVRNELINTVPTNEFRDTLYDAMNLDKNIEYEMTSLISAYVNNIVYNIQGYNGSNMYVTR